jgi:hypothetical protein
MKRNHRDYWYRRKHRMYLTIPPPMKLIDLETGEVLEAKHVIDQQSGKTFEELGIPVPNPPVSMHRFFIKQMLHLFDTPPDAKKAKRILRALKKGEDLRAAGEPAVVEIIDDDLTLWKEKRDKRMQVNGNLLVQYEDFFNALDDATREEPKKKSAAGADHALPAPPKEQASA